MKSYNVFHESNLIYHAALSTDQQVVFKHNKRKETNTTDNNLN